MNSGAPMANLILGMITIVYAMCALAWALVDDGFVTLRASNLSRESEN